MDVRDTIHGRRTVHRYRPDPIPEGALGRALAAAIQAPNHKLTFPWRFTRVGASARRTLADLAVALKCPADAPPPAPERVAAIRAKITNPAELVVVSLVRHDDPIVAREDYASAACAIQNFSLSLWAEGVGSKWSSGKMTRHVHAYQTCAIDDAVEEIIGFLWAGMPEAVPEPPERPALDTLIRTVD